MEKRCVIYDYTSIKICRKKAVYLEGNTRLESLMQHSNRLRENGVAVVEGELKDNSFVMPFVDAEVGQVYLKRLLKNDIDKFLFEMDRFRDIILKSSPIDEIDKGDGMGAILKYGFLDLFR